MTSPGGADTWAHVGCWEEGGFWEPLGWRSKELGGWGGVHVGSALSMGARPLTFAPSVLSHTLLCLGGPGLRQGRGLTTSPGHSAFFDLMVERPFLSWTPSLLTILSYK